MIDLIKSAKKCYRIDTEKLYDVTNIDIDHNEVTIVKTWINNGSEAKQDKITETISMDLVKFLTYAPKRDEMGRQILQNDIVAYGDKQQYKGIVLFHDEKCCFVIKPIGDTPFSKFVYYLHDIDDKYLHVISNRYEDAYAKS